MLTTSDDRRSEADSQKRRTGRGTEGRIAAHLPVEPHSVLDDLNLRIVRAPRVTGAPVPGHEARWAGHLRRIGAARLKRCGLEDLVDSAQLLISELVTNALRYGEGREIGFRFLLTPDLLVIEVDDGSLTTPQVLRPAHERGRGMLLLSVVAKDWGISPGGGRTWCSLALRTRKPG